MNTKLQPHGFGRQVNGTKGIYEGMFKNGEKTGYGRRIFKHLKKPQEGIFIDGTFILNHKDKLERNQNITTHGNVLITPLDDNEILKYSIIEKYNNMNTVSSASRG